MEKYIDIILKSSLFSNIDRNDVLNMINSFQNKSYKKGNTIIDIGDYIDNIYLILDGMVEVSKEYDDARKNIVNILNAGDIFAESFALSTNKISTIQALSFTDTKILKINTNNIFNNSIFLKNLIRVLSDKNIFLSIKNDILSQKSLRSKIMLYLKYMSNIQKSNNIVIPYNRDKLAEFISSDRSALSRELNRLSKEKIIKLEGNKITILKH
ncbi:Crp/Fnr family transcriptional regulator [Brachyspira pilosicoli]|uniref:Cyclic nucleotide-binding protein n=3 Tax=Brachyspira pilosicoli TaxID=52584 RepID=D8IG75_BRAP9|nr:Crp/Fnr family transcriptional regulator [Brachyspira pilosicoli]ADK32139.1 cyclic nucleotide-binding protein [Brachyspira pilosicoli 95/1000]WIH82090.1 Crp/Fnr family transcriptional regulator [Brachyspira pilosicoli]WIH88360.1 Crp/Fnr family transcriptional regulator [Brachyspira pilosicoli]WIH90637.1 Crp/Fnr family transcriptional regulator [Brachyspira pilosicoli]WIH92928.1 Crp/Fnr family transcriptional regulator [Brachyspira pilosicoli]